MTYTQYMTYTLYDGHAADMDCAGMGHRQDQSAGVRGLGETQMQSASPCDRGMASRRHKVTMTRPCACDFHTGLGLTYAFEQRAYTQ